MSAYTTNPNQKRRASCLVSENQLLILIAPLAIPASHILDCIFLAENVDRVDRGPSLDILKDQDLRAKSMVLSDECKLHGFSGLQRSTLSEKA